MHQKQLTIFTPTYNRARLLPRLYESICRQDSNDFLWLIVDDGSTDNTRQLVTAWQQEAKVEIVYHRQENGGKMRAHNTGVALCETPLFLCIDSDDWFSSPTAVSDTLHFWHQHAETVQREDICGMISFKSIDNKTCRYPQDVETTSLTALYESGFEGETAIMFKTDIIRQYPFPVADGEKFVTEAVVFDLLDSRYQMLLFPYYSQTCEYQQDGYTRSGMDLIYQSPKGYRLFYNQRVALKHKDWRYNTQMYIALSLLIGDGNIFSLASNKWLTLMLFPMGLYQYYKLKHRKW